MADRQGRAALAGIALVPNAMPTIRQVSLSCRRRGEVTYPDQVVGGQREGEHPVHPRNSTVSRLPHHADRLQPAEDLFDPLPLPMADQVCGMPCRSTVDRTITFLLRDVGHHILVPQGLQERSDVVAFV